MGKQEAPAYTVDLANWAMNCDLKGVQPEVRREAARTLLNWVGCAVGGADNEAAETAMRALAPFSGTPSASVLGRAERFDPLTTALLNGIASHVYDFDDTHLLTAIHPGGPVLAAIVSLAEHRSCTGAQLVEALIVGVEVEIRVGLSVHPAHYDAGWHITGTAGVIGAAAASARLLGLDAQRGAWAIGIAATQSAGFREMFGSMCKSFHVGRAGQGGLSAALLAQAGFNSSQSSLEGRRGFAQVLSSDRSLEHLTANLGDTFEIMSNSYKPFPCGLVVHPAIDVCLQLVAEHALDVKAIKSVSLGVHPSVLELCGKTNPTNELEAKFSVYHAAAVALLRGRARMAEFSDAAAVDPEVIALRDRVRATVREGVAKTQVEIEIEFSNGERLSQRLEQVSGSLERPLSDKAMADKVHDLGDRLLGAKKVNALIAACLQVNDLPDAGDIARATVPG